MEVGNVESRHTAYGYRQFLWRTDFVRRYVSEKIVLKSPLFTVSDDKDELKWYLSLEFRKDKQYSIISYYARLVLDRNRTNNCTEVFVKFNLYIEEIGRKGDSDLRQNQPRKLIKKGQNWWKVFFYHRNPSTITVVCELQIESVFSEGDYSFSRDFGSLLENQQFSDVVLTVGEKKYPAHKVILGARSSVFDAMFSHNMLENQSGVVHIKDMDEDTVEEMLSYIYTGKIRKSELAPDLFIAAEKYNLKGLRWYCEEFLAANLSSSNVSDLAILADLYNANHLKSEAMKYLGTLRTQPPKLRDESHA